MIQRSRNWMPFLFVFILALPFSATADMDSGWKNFITSTDQTCRSEAQATPTPNLDVFSKYDDCFQVTSLISSASSQCTAARLKAQGAQCAGSMDEISCYNDVRSAVEPACESAVRTNALATRAKAQSDLQASSLTPKARGGGEDCDAEALAALGIQGTCTTSETGSDPTPNPTGSTCEGAMSGEVDSVSTDKSTIYICVTSGQAPIGVTQSQCGSLPTAETQANCKSHFETLAATEESSTTTTAAASDSDDKKTRSKSPLDTDNNGIVSTEEREQADTDGDGYISESEKQAAAERKLASESDISACDAAFAEATLCCTNPMACLIGGNDEHVGSQVQQGIGLVATGGQMYAGYQTQNAQMEGKPSSAMCDFMNTAGTVGAGINAASAAVCMQKKSVCNSICKGTSTGKCDQFNTNVAQAAMQAVSMGLASKIASQCQQMTASSNGLQPSDLDFMPDCSDPANSSNPNCNGDCSGPDAASNPFCKTAINGANATGAGGSGTSYGMDSTNYGSNSAEAYDSNPNLGDSIGEQMNLGSAAEGQAQANAIQGGGGGGMGNGAGSASLGDDRGGQSAGGGYNTGVLKGVAGGGGYVGPSTGSVGVSSAGGGFRGYGNTGGGGTDSIDLKQFLPGGKKDPRKRTVAGLAGSVAGQIGRKETNIFQTMSVKYRQMCQLKRMWDCPNLPTQAGRRQ